MTMEWANTRRGPLLRTISQPEGFGVANALDIYDDSQDPDLLDF